jgi:hypothetical protein
MVLKFGRFGKFEACSLTSRNAAMPNRIWSSWAFLAPMTAANWLSAGPKRPGFYGCANYPECEWSSWKGRCPALPQLPRPAGTEEPQLGAVFELRKLV